MIPDEVVAFIGKVVPPVLREVEAGAIRRYADAIGNDNPPHSDREYASEPERRCGRPIIPDLHRSLSTALRLWSREGSITGNSGGRLTCRT